MLYLIGVFDLLVIAIAYKVFIHDELVLKRKEPYKVPSLSKLKTYLLSTIIKKSDKECIDRYSFIN